MIKKIPSNLLTKGMYVCGNDRKWLETPFFRSKFLIKSDQQLQTFRAYCRFAYIDTEKGLDVPEVASVASSAAEDAATVLYQNTLRTLYDPTLPDAVAAHDHAVVAAVVSDLTSGLERHGECLLELTLADTHQTEAATPVNACIQSLAMARHLRLNPQRADALAQLGLLCGLNKPLPRSSDIPVDHQPQIEAIATATIARQCRFRLSQLEKLISGDAEHAMTEESKCWISMLYGFNDLYLIYHQLPQAELRILQRLSFESPSLFNAESISAFAETLKLYPPGFIVELITGELAQIVAVGDDHLHIRHVTTRQKQLLTQSSSAVVNTGSAVARVIPPDDPILNLLHVDHCVDNPALK